ncbi:replicative DNA helicase [Bacillus sp. ISL-47]|uniref:replicative DNA helicase n=1 Tax=Bacillus sp. ISL-47 TaxID=2819130 RepID=UPI001BE88891|nr:replicative DNA helicase [Bacillus sp. ISL-47]MBT2687292.1 replicative DNA helicase [Bacillus sp. ISL-47]MBT2706638.1 replicative DNA helicase [Pseudomonas sp. ISL-84]
MLQATNQNEVINIEAEQSVLGSILMEGNLVKEVFLKPFEFYMEKHQIIFETMIDLNTKKDPVDIVSIISNMDDISRERIGGVSYLTELAISVPSLVTFKFHQQLVRRAFMIRKSLKLCNLFEKNPSVDLLPKLIKNLNELIVEENSTDTTNQEVISEIYNEIVNPRSGLSGIDTGFKDFNTMTDGLQNGDLIILAARPSVGKTALALNFAMNACKNNVKVIYFSLEMPKKQLIYRMVSSLARVDLMLLRQGGDLLTKDEHERAEQALGIIDKWDMIINDNDNKSSQSIYDISLNIRSQLWKEPNKDCLVIIDYLQLIKTDLTINRHDLRIGEITRELKLLAKELNIPIVLLSQLNRNVENRIDKRPFMSDLKDSGNIEQDADVILLLHRDDYYNRNSDSKNKIEVNVAKHRNGPVGAIELSFLKDTGTFLDLAKK